jgi:hypothetical protein
MPLRFLPVLLCFAAFLPCQGGETTEEVTERPESIDRRKAAGEKAERGEKGENGDGSDENLTPEQRLARNITSGASNHCRFIASVKPAKLMPGETGTLEILATLQGRAVLPAPAPLEMVGSAQQGAVTLGALMLDSAPAGRIEQGYLGRPVYENWAVLRVPVTMAPTAQIGSKHTVAVDLKFDLYDGTSAQPIGRFLDRAATEIEVGKLADPVVKGLPAAGAGSGASPGAAAVPPVAPKDEPAAPTATPPAGAQVVPGTAIPAPAAQPTSEPTAAEPGPAATELSTDDGGSLPMPLLLGGGAILLVLVLLLARRK